MDVNVRMAYTGHPYRQRDIYSMLQTISATPYSRGVNGRTCIGVSLRNSCVNYPRRESNPHLRFRKPPFCPLNYGDASESQKEEVRRMKGKNPEIRFSIVDFSVADFPRKLVRESRHKISCSSLGQKV